MQANKEYFLQSPILKMTPLQYLRLSPYTVLCLLTCELLGFWRLVGEVRGLNHNTQVCVGDLTAVSLFWMHGLYAYGKHLFYTTVQIYTT